MSDLRTYHFYAAHGSDDDSGRWAVSAVAPESGEVLGTVHDPERDWGRSAGGSGYWRGTRPALTSTWARTTGCW